MSSVPDIGERVQPSADVGIGTVTAYFVDNGHFDVLVQLELYRRLCRMRHNRRTEPEREASHQGHVLVRNRLLDVVNNFACDLLKRRDPIHLQSI